MPLPIRSARRPARRPTRRPVRRPGLKSLLAPFLVAVLLLGGVASCAVNPVTGQREFTLISESQEIQIGREADGDITASMGLVDDPGLQRYVQELGQRMAERSERPDLPWTFRVLDDPLVNAFALPGGYIYVTRGILAHFASEAELAGVLGHEIGHVTARHGVRQVSRAQLAQVTLGVGTVLFPEMEAFEGLLSGGMSLLLLRYGRDAERQADDLGLTYMTGQSYDPREMAATFEMLYHASGGDEADRLPGWLSSHPDPLERRDRILQRVAQEEISGERVERDGYLQRLDGLVFGPNPREGYFRNGTFLHPAMAFRLDFPAGWRTVNQRQAVQGVSPEQDALLALTLASQDSPEAARSAFLGSQGITGGNLRSRTIHGLQAATADFRASTQQGNLLGTVAFIAHQGQVFRILGYAPEARWDARSGVIRGAVDSFQPVTDRTVLDVQPRRIQLVRTDGAMTLEAFHQRFPSTVPVETVGLINRVQPGQTIPSGTLMKRVAGQGAP
jgi:predicted Zn-dependent protease